MNFNISRMKMLNTFCKKYLQAGESDFNVISFICSPNKVSIDNLPPDLAYFQSLASNSSTHERLLPWLMRVFFSLSMMVELGGKYEP